MANHSREWHDVNEELKDKMREARDAWKGPDHAKAKELDREVADLERQLSRLD